jgi:hypothetical protein
VKHGPTDYERVNDEVVALLRHMGELNDVKAVEAIDKQLQQKMDELRALRHSSSSR